MNRARLGHLLRRPPAPLATTETQTLIRCLTVLALATIGEPSLLEAVIRWIGGG